MDITIKVPDLGQVAGTVAHTLAYLQGVKLHLNNNSRGNLCLYARSGEYDEIVAMYAPDFDERILTKYVDKENGYFAPSPGPTETTMANNGVSFFGPLTPPAWEMVDNFLQQCVDALKTAVETDGFGHHYSIKIDID